MKLSHLSKEKKKKLLFEIFDILLADKQKKSSQQIKKKRPKEGVSLLQFLIVDKFPWQITMKVQSK